MQYSCKSNLSCKAGPICNPLNQSGPNISNPHVARIQQALSDIILISHVLDIILISHVISHVMGDGPLFPAFLPDVCQQSALPCIVQSNNCQRHCPPGGPFWMCPTSPTCKETIQCLLPTHSTLLLRLLSGLQCGCFCAPTVNTIQNAEEGESMPRCHRQRLARSPLTLLQHLLTSFTSSHVGTGHKWNLWLLLLGLY